jgi:hypothetical protein
MSMSSMFFASASPEGVLCLSLDLLRSVSTSSKSFDDAIVQGIDRANNNSATSGQRTFRSTYSRTPVPISIQSNSSSS